MNTEYYEPSFAETKARLQKLNEVVLSSYIKNHCANLRAMSDPRGQGAELNRIALGMLFEEHIDLDRIIKKSVDAYCEKMRVKDQAEFSKKKETP